MKKTVKMVFSFGEKRMTGLAGKMSSRSPNLICCSFHLKMRVPCGLSTRQHSCRPWARYSFQPKSGRVPYFWASQLLSPAFLKWGGVEKHQGECPVPEGKVPEVHFHVGMDVEFPYTSWGVAVRQGRVQVTDVAEEDTRVFLVEVEHPGAATRVKDGLQ